MEPYGFGMVYGPLLLRNMTCFCRLILIGCWSFANLSQRWPHLQSSRVLVPNTGGGWEISVFGSEFAGLLVFDTRVAHLLEFDTGDANWFSLGVFDLFSSFDWFLFCFTFPSNRKCRFCSWPLLIPFAHKLLLPSFLFSARSHRSTSPPRRFLSTGVLLKLVSVARLACVHVAEVWLQVVIHAGT